VDRIWTEAGGRPPPVYKVAKVIKQHGGNLYILDNLVKESVLKSKISFVIFYIFNAKFTECPNTALQKMYWSVFSSKCLKGIVSQYKESILIFPLHSLNIFFNFVFVVRISIFHSVVTKISHCTELYLIAPVVKKIAEWSVSMDLMCTVFQTANTCLNITISTCPISIYILHVVVTWQPIEMALSGDGQ
jgi:hypothetical protein